MSQLDTQPVLEHNELRGSLALGRAYLNLLCSGADIDELEQLFAADLVFEGPLFKCNRAQDYLERLKSDPPRDWTYRVRAAFEQGSRACLFYTFSKPGLEVPMAQLFEAEGGRLTKISLIFDATQFKT